jgi:hypothetical protein
MCFSTPKIPDPPKAAPIPNRQNDASQAAINATLKRARSQDVTAATTLTGGLGDTGFGQNISRVTALGAA